jgi:hypothetical protein
MPGCCGYADKSIRATRQKYWSGNMRTRFAFVKEVTVAFTTDPVYPSQNNARDLLAGLDPSPQKTWLRISARGSRFAHAA